MLNGYHVYYTYPSTKPKNPYEPINILVQLASALHWRKFFGPIHLYCDEAHLAVLKEYGVDSVYDTINLDLLSHMPPVDGRYWAFSKIYLAQYLLKTQSSLVLVDTDLWVSGPLESFDPTLAVQGLHTEIYDVEHPYTPYIEPFYFNFDGKGFDGWDWSILPINCAFLYLNDVELVNEWYRRCLEVIETNVNTQDYGGSREMVFMEQRLLPTLADRMNKRVSTVLQVSFNTCLPYDTEESVNPWYPPFDSSLELSKSETIIKHVWGRKKRYGEKKIRTGIIKSVISDLQKNFTIKELSYHIKLIDECAAFI